MKSKQPKLRFLSYRVKSFFVLFTAALALAVLMASCSSGVKGTQTSQEELSFQMLSEGTRFTDKSKNQDWPYLLAMTSDQDVNAPGLSFEFGAELKKQLQSANYQNSLVCLYRTNVSNTEKIARVWQSGDTVHIEVSQPVAGPGGAFPLQGLTMPYNVVMITKSVSGEKPKTLVLETKDGTELSKISLK